MLLASSVRGEPCIVSTVMRTGSIATCDGILVEPPRAVQCVKDTYELSACEIRRQGAEKIYLIQSNKHDRTIKILKDVLHTELEVARNRKPVILVTDWTAVVIGITGGILVGIGLSLTLAYVIK